jgi:hypothetical protein
MKESELRIGNYIKTEFGTSKVRGTAKEAVWLNSLGGPIRLDGFLGIQPVELTKDILLKCGFEDAIDADNDEYFIFNNLKLYWYEFALNTCNGFYFRNDVNGDLKIKHLHQLQNLYFALTGNELSVSKI